MASKGQEIARKIVQQAMDHETAIETKISLATLLIGIEMEFDAAFARSAPSEHRLIELINEYVGCAADGITINGQRECAREILRRWSVLAAAEQVRGSEAALGNELGALWQAIVYHTKGDLFWIGEILLDELRKETGYSPSPATTPGK